MYSHYWFFKCSCISVHLLLFTVKPQSIVSKWYIHYTMFIMGNFWTRRDMRENEACGNKG
jgi:hypothetical protein